MNDAIIPLCSAPMPLRPNTEHMFVLSIALSFKETSIDFKTVECLIEPGANVVVGCRYGAAGNELYCSIVNPRDGTHPLQ
jgi:hypothetical protein